MLKPNVRTDLRLYSIRDPFRANQPLWKVLKSLKCVFFYTGCRVLCIGDRGGCVQRTEMCENCVSGGCVWVSGAFVIYPDLSSWQKRGDRAINFECRSCSSYSASPFHPSHTNTHTFLNHCVNAGELCGREVISVWAEAQCSSTAQLLEQGENSLS